MVIGGFSLGGCAEEATLTSYQHTAGHKEPGEEANARNTSGKMKPALGEEAQQARKVKVPVEERQDYPRLFPRQASPVFAHDALDVERELYDMFSVAMPEEIHSAAGLCLNEKSGGTVVSPGHHLRQGGYLMAPAETGASILAERLRANGASLFELQGGRDPELRTSGGHVTFQIRTPKNLETKSDLKEQPKRQAGFGSAAAAVLDCLTALAKPPDT